ncbi:hypothetical protein [Trichococcus shcherbakoviae]|uniref:hypothetical protein n=1 Tax=Trichococcus shcherbakoviae TaxID=2094020 RepID=UPI002AA61396|nr:hypothetical protein [Trichococcus shcherbakoviae]
MSQQIDRRGQLLLVLDAMFSTHRDWVESDTPYMTEVLEIAVENVIEIFSTGDVPSDCRELTKLVDELERQWSVYRDDASIKNDPTFLPNNDFWKVVDRLRRSREVARPKPQHVLESIEELTSQKVSDRQICIIYGWIDGKGQPELRRLQEERKNPGTHTGKDFVHPLERKRIEEEERRRQIVENVRQAQQRKLQRKKVEPKESLEQLVADNVSVKQIAVILGCSTDEVSRRIAAAGLSMPADNYDPNPTGGINESQVRKAAGIGRSALPSISSEEVVEDAVGGDEGEVIQDDEFNDDGFNMDGMDDVQTDHNGAVDSPAFAASNADIAQQAIDLRDQGIEDIKICHALGIEKRELWKIYKNHKKQAETAVE